MASSASLTNTLLLTKPLVLFLLFTDAALYSMGVAIATSKDHDIDIYLLSRYITQMVVLLSPNVHMYLKNKVSLIVYTIMSWRSWKATSS